ncbi:hypothetical protein SKAU_G00415300 [Synaphobranchus kaupii]|uniref:Uncharacterized protein n=1 Tax=Synaphobranchus kaupii TaxID=118154 RepID=A0A9Q1E786_SYNKA|nr:hypothetical protein SKAU_G00415300 [Synaphobranchus kaupii]
MKCLEGEGASQHTGILPGETQEETGPEAPHRARSIQVAQPVPQRPPEKVRVQWPQACKMTVWQQFDEDTDKVLEATAKGDVDRRLQTMTTIIVSLAVERADWHRRRRKERARKLASFIANPFGFTKQLLGQKLSGRLACSKEEIDLHIQTTYSDPERQQELGHCNILIEPPPPVKEFDSREPLLKEVQDVVKRARSSSAPGPSGVPYKVYKNCPLLLKRLWKILKVTWR